MDINRRALLAAAAVPAAALLTTPSTAQPLSSYGADVSQFGVCAGASEDQSRALQRAIDRIASTHTPLVLGPGVYRAGDLRLPAGAQLLGVRGATRLVFTQGSALLTANNADGITLSGLVIDGGAIRLPDNRGLINFSAGRSMRIVDCEVIWAGSHAIMLDGIEGQVTGTTVTDAADTAIFSLNARGLMVSGNIIRRAGNGGIRIWQSEKRDDGTIVVDNRIDDISAHSGGSGENGNAINPLCPKCRA